MSKVLDAKGEAQFVVPADLALLALAAKNGLRFAIVSSGLVMAVGATGHIPNPTHRLNPFTLAWEAV